MPLLRQQSIAAFVDELDRAESLGLLGVVIHPGTCTAGSEDDALRLVADAIASAFKTRPRQKVKVLLEHTAGQGRTVGHRFEQLSTILAYLDGSPRIGVCLDTCHLLASGYNIADAAGYEDTFVSFERIVGLERLEVFHGNDSKKPCGSRVDRHEHIGKGFVGLEPFRRLLADPRFTSKAILIETEKGQKRRAGWNTPRRSLRQEESRYVADTARYFLPSDALMSATDVRRSGFRLCTDMIRSTSSFSRSMLSANTMVPVTGGSGTGASAGGRLNMSA